MVNDFGQFFYDNIYNIVTSLEDTNQHRDCEDKDMMHTFCAFEPFSESAIRKTIQETIKVMPTWPITHLAD